MQNIKIQKFSLELLSVVTWRCHFLMILQNDKQLCHVLFPFLLKSLLVAHATHPMLLQWEELDWPLLLGLTLVSAVKHEKNHVFFNLEVAATEKITLQPSSNPWMDHNT